MLIIIDRSKLFEKVVDLNRLIPNKPTHPILATIKVTTGENKIKLQAFDLAIGAEWAVEAEVETEGEICIPAQLFKETLNKLPVGKLNLESSSETLVITSTKTSFEIRCLPVTDFPAIPFLDDEEFQLLDIDQFKAGLKYTTPFASNDETKQVLQGVNLKIAEGIKFSSTDGHRAAQVERLLEYPLKEAEVTIPRQTLSEVLKSLHDDTEDLKFAATETNVQFNFPNGKIYSRVYEGAYPDVDKLFPAQHFTEISLDRKEFIGALDAANLFADNKNNIVIFNWDLENNRFIVSAEDSETGSANTTLEMILEGEPEYEQIAANCKYLIEAIKTLDSERVVFKLNLDTTPIVIQSPEDDQTRLLVMPISLKQV